MLELKRLRLLSELSRRGTIAEVASVVGYTPSAVSQSLAQLEREAGVALLERDGRRVRLTPAAHGLVAATDRVLAELDAAEAELAAEHETVRGEIVIGAFPSAAAGLVVPAVAELNRQHPEVDCTVREHEPEDGIPLLRSGDLDLLVSESYDDVPSAPVGGLESHRLLTEPLLLVTAGDDSQQAVRPSRRRLDRRSGGHAVRGRARGRLRRGRLHAADRPPRRRRAPDPGARRGRARASRSLPALACEPASGVRYLDVTPSPPRRHVWALARRGATRRPALAAALSALREVRPRSCSVGSRR